jgi:deoxyadenosine/deoxycytidine kinase
MALNMASNGKKTNVISLEGNIGTGKSTLLNHIKEHFNYKGYKNICFLFEPIDIWNSITDKQGITILEKYYANQERFAFTFQMMAYISRLTQLRNALKENCYDLIITERSLFTDKEVFAKMLYDNNKIEEIEYNIYLKWFNEFVSDLPEIKFIYLQADPTISFNRINKRSRLGEGNIPLSYLENCHNYHENWLIKNNNYYILENSLLYVLNANLELDNTLISWLHIIEDILLRNNYIIKKL